MALDDCVREIDWDALEVPEPLGLTRCVGVFDWLPVEVILGVPDELGLQVGLGVLV